MFLPMVDEKEIWTKVLSSPIGLLVKVDRPDSAIQKLYRARKLMDNPVLDNFEIRRTVSPNVLAIVKVQRG